MESEEILRQSEHSELSMLISKIESNEIDPNDVIKLMQIGRTHGFESISKRKKIWPVLLEINIENLQKSSDFLEWNRDRDSHSDEYEQLKKDAMRSLYSFSMYKDMDPHFLKKKQDDLLVLLDAFSKNQPRYRYFQGFHDIVSIFIGMFGSNVGYYMSHRMATTYMRDNFLYSFKDTVVVLDKLIYFVTMRSDPDFEQIFSEFDDQQLTFTAPWIITWFAHSFQDINTICRLWDFLISSQPVAIVYLCTAMILHTKHQLIEHCEEYGGYDHGAVHSFYQKLKDIKINTEMVARKAIELQKIVDVTRFDPINNLPEETVMKEQNFTKLIRLHELYKLTQRRRERDRRTTKMVLIGVGLLALGLWSYSVFSKKSTWKSITGIIGQL